jgi:hypothetical protein
MSVSFDDNIADLLPSAGEGLLLVELGRRGTKAERRGDLWLKAGFFNEEDRDSVDFEVLAGTSETAVSSIGLGSSK